MSRPPFSRIYCALALCSALLGAAAAQGGGSDQAAQTAPAVGQVSGPLIGPVGGQVTVAAGDTAYSLARRAGISVEQLLALNGLSSPNLRVGQVLRLSETLTHTVQPGETLYALARRYGVSVDALLAENRLPVGAVLAIGQTLTLPAEAKAPPVPPGTPAATRPAVPAPTLLAPTPPAPAPTTAALPNAFPSLALPSALPRGVSGSPFLPGMPHQTAPVLTDPDRLPQPGAAPQGAAPEPAPAAPTSPAADQPLPGNWRDAALALLGTPYVYGGMSRSGTDCSGLVLQVFGPLGFRLPRVSAQQAQVGRAVGASELQAGDLVFFDTDGRGAVSHVGIYLGDDQFVNANSYQGKVVIDRLMADRYWAPRYVGARRILGEVLAQRP